jgi:hypothetical protein
VPTHSYSQQAKKDWQTKALKKDRQAKHTLGKLDHKTPNIPKQETRKEKGRRKSTQRAIDCRAPMKAHENGLDPHVCYRVLGGSGRHVKVKREAVAEVGQAMVRSRDFSKLVRDRGKAEKTKGRNVVHTTSVLPQPATVTSPTTNGFRGAELGFLKR